jgi:riboflavin kinase/FMN adenylyltransferase
LKVFKVVRSAGQPVSSTVIRKLIKEGRISQAQKLLGRRVSVLGSVVKGRRIARGMGFPTANIDPHHEVIPPPGIYAVRIVFASKPYDGICYIGRRPTVGHKKSPMQVEVHVFDFYKNIYGRFMEIQFVKFIRPDKKFPSLKELSIQIKKDIIFSRNILKRSR